MHASVPYASRRQFLMRTCGGIGGLALSHLLGQDGLLAAPAAANGLPGRTHHQPRAKNLIYIYL